MTMPNETPEEWAESLLEEFSVAISVDDDSGWYINTQDKRRIVSTLAATKRDAEAMSYWKTEALARAVGSPTEYIAARTARINAGLT